MVVWLGRKPFVYRRVSFNHRPHLEVGSETIDDGLTSSESDGKSSLARGDGGISWLEYVGLVGLGRGNKYGSEWSDADITESWEEDWGEAGRRVVCNWREESE